MYHCDTCKKHFKNTRTFSLHNKSESHKKRESNQLILHICGCGKSFQHRQGLYRHKKSCTFVSPQPQVNENETKTEVDQLREENESLHEEIKQLKADKSVTNNIGTQNNNVTIHVNAFGNENIDHITESYMLRCINHVHGSIPMLVKHIYCDPHHPENHTVKISNYRHPFIKIMNKNQKWENANKEQIKSNIITKSYYLLDTTYEGNKDKISAPIQRNFERMQEKFNNGEKVMMKTLTRDVDMVLMNGPG